MAKNQKVVRENSLKNLRTFDQMTPEEAKAIRQKGNIAMHKVVRERKTMKQALDIILSHKCKDKTIIKKMKELGITDEEFTNLFALCVSLYNQALTGNVRAIEVLQATIDEAPTHKINIEETPIITDDIK